METRLKSILRRIRWSLALKAAFVALSWLWLPHWAFFVLCLYFYFVPIFHPWKLFVPFLVFLFLALNTPASIGFAIIMGALFYTIVGIKDLIFIDRKSAYDALVLAFALLLDLWLFSSLGDAMSSSALVAAFTASIAQCLIYREALRYSQSGREAVHERPSVGISLGLTWLIVAEILLATLFLPVNFLYQSALAFFSSALLLEVVSLHLEGGLSRHKILAAFSIIFVFLIIIFGSASWGV